jgi:hypothetical protein
MAMPVAVLVAVMPCAASDITALIASPTSSDCGGTPGGRAGSVGRALRVCLLAA